jgi:hypothetical protein
MNDSYMHKYMKYILYTSDVDLSRIFYVESMIDDYEGFRILVGDSEARRVIRIRFEAPLMIRKLDEGDLSRTLAADSSPKGCGIYTVSQSDALQWFVDESAGKFKSEELVHYAIVSANDYIDVISKYPPVLDVLAGEG